MKRRGPLALGIDIGTSGVRAAVVGSHGRVAEAKVALPVGSRTDVFHVQQPEDWWSALETCLDILRRQVDFRRVQTLAIDGTSGTVLLVNQVGQVIGPALMYDDGRATREARFLKKIVPKGAISHTAFSPLAKALWLHRRQQERGTVIHRLAHQADWLAGRFCGRFGVTDENNALKTGYDPAKRRWPAWIHLAGSVAGILPAVEPAGTRLGIVSEEVARRFGFAKRCGVALGTTDSIAAFLATGAEKIGDASSSWGTTLAIKMLVNRPLYDSRSGIYSHRIGDRWLVGGASNVGGGALLKHFSPEEIGALSARMDPATPTGLSYYPLAKAGERFPICDAALSPCFSPRPRDKAVFLQAIFEGLAAVEKLAYDKLEALAQTRLNTIFTTGGVARNRAFQVIRERVLQRPIVECNDVDAACGVAGLALRARAR